MQLFLKNKFLKKKLKLKKKFNIFYIRFFFHAITEEMEKNFLKNLKITLIKKVFFSVNLEQIKIFNKKGIKISENERYTTHYRRFIELKSFKKRLKYNKFKILYEKRVINLR